MTVEALKKYVLVKTPCVLFKDALVALEKDDALHPVDPPKGRRARRFPDGMKVRFERVQGRLF